MAELRAAQAQDIGAIVAIDPHSPARPAQIQALIRDTPAWSPMEHGQVAREGVDVATFPTRSARKSSSSSSAQAMTRVPTCSARQV